MLIYVWLFSDTNIYITQTEKALFGSGVDEAETRDCALSANSMKKFWKRRLTETAFLCVVLRLWRRYYQHTQQLCRSWGRKCWSPDWAEVQCIRPMLYILLLCCPFAHLHPFAFFPSPGAPNHSNNVELARYVGAPISQGRGNTWSTSFQREHSSPAASQEYLF